MGFRRETDYHARRMPCQEFINQDLITDISRNR